MEGVVLAPVGVRTCWTVALVRAFGAASTNIRNVVLEIIQHANGNELSDEIAAFDAVVQAQFTR